MKTIKLFLVAMIATIAVTTSSCSKNDDNENITASVDKINGTIWQANVDKVGLDFHGTYTLNFQKDSNICTMQFNHILKGENGVIITNTTVTKTGAYTFDKDWGDRGYFIFPDNSSNKVSMMFKNGEKIRFYLNNQSYNIDGIIGNYDSLEVGAGQLIDNGSRYQTIFSRIKK